MPTTVWRILHLLLPHLKSQMQLLVLQWSVSSDKSASVAMCKLPFPPLSLFYFFNIGKILKNMLPTIILSLAALSSFCHCITSLVKSTLFLLFIQNIELLAP